MNRKNDSSKTPGTISIQAIDEIAELVKLTNLALKMESNMFRMAGRIKDEKMKTEMKTKLLRLKVVPKIYEVMLSKLKGINAGLRHVVFTDMILEMKTHLKILKRLKEEIDGQI